MADEQDQVLARIDGLASAVKSGFDRVDARFHAIETGLDARFNRLKTGLDALTAEVRTGFERVDRRLGNLEVRVEGVETELREVKADVRGLNKRVTVLESKIDP